LIPYSETFPRSGMTRSGIAYRLPPLVRLTSGIGSGSWPTPRGSKRGPRAREGAELLLRKQGRSRHHRLEDATICFPTPNSRDWKGPGYEGQLPTVLSGYPNPAFVEWLMGFPMGWTDDC